MIRNTSNLSVIIPTRNRLDSLNRALKSIYNQLLLPSEIIIVDSSDNKIKIEDIIVSDNNIDLKILYSKPSVCLQRNIGIENCHSDYIFLCDDDIEVSENYIEVLIQHLESNPLESIVSGLIFEKRNGKWSYCNEKISAIGLIMTYVFCTSLTVDLAKVKFSNNYIQKSIISYYKKKGNYISKAGWPIITNFESDIIKTPIYGLGASVIRANKLKKTMYDTAFYAHGIGDNYDLAINIDAKINVIKKARAFHHKEPINRIKNTKAYYYRVAALHYIMKKHKKFNKSNLIYFAWSLVSNSIRFLLKGKLKLLFYNFELIVRIIFNKPLYKTKA